MPHPIPSRRLALLAVLSLMCVTQGAEAHAILMDSSPALGSTIDAGPAELVLRFNSRIDAGRSRLALVRPDGTQLVLPLSPETQPDRLVTRTDLAPGSYVVRWQVLAVDGHITRGNVPFTVKAR